MSIWVAALACPTRDGDVFPTPAAYGEMIARVTRDWDSAQIVHIPIATGTACELKLGEHWLGRVAVLDGVPGDPTYPKHTAIKLSGQDGALIVGEVNYQHGGTKAAIGACGYTARFDPVLPSATPGRGNQGAYSFAEHRLAGTRADDAAGLAGWLRFGIADARYNPIASYLGGGLVYAGITPGRPDDQIGLSFASANFGDRYRRRQALTGDMPDNREVVVEAVYNAVIAPWLSVQPDLQCRESRR